METKLKSELGLSFIKPRSSVGGGCISDAKVFETENGPIFVKINNSSVAKDMFDGEVEGLRTIKNTKTVRVPNPIKVINLGNSGYALAMEYIEMKGLSTHAELLGEQLARMHLANLNVKKLESSVHKALDDETEGQVFVDKFGYHCTTCCGSIRQDNVWKNDWVEFYAQQKIDYQLKLIQASYGDREAIELWSELSLKLPILFKDIEVIPSILHGDLWSGNVAETIEGPVIYDPAVFYGHSEYELGIADMFGGFPRSFYNAYHNILPKQPNFEKRKDLYKLFHCLNHWNIFGGGYRSSSLSIMKRLLNTI